jgi:hypothetical protein
MEMLEADHTKVKALFDKFESAGDRMTYIPYPFLEFGSNFDNASARERRTSYAQRMSAHRTLCFSGLFFFITTSCELGGLFLTLVGEPQGFRFPARRAAHTHPAPRFPGAGTRADIPLIALEGAPQFLVAAGDAALRPLVVGGQPAQPPLL